MALYGSHSCIKKKLFSKKEFALVVRKDSQPESIAESVNRKSPV